MLCEFKRLRLPWTTSLFLCLKGHYLRKWEDRNLRNEMRTKSWLILIDFHSFLAIHSKKIDIRVRVASIHKFTHLKNIHHGGRRFQPLNQKSCHRPSGLGFLMLVLAVLGSASSSIWLSLSAYDRIIHCAFIWEWNNDKCEMRNAEWLELQLWESAGPGPGPGPSLNHGHSGHGTWPG